MNCYRTSNNKFFTAPPRMADGRHFTDYRENVMLNDSIRTQGGAKNSYEYRLFLTNNAEKIMDLNNKQAFLLNGVTDCKQPYEVGTMLPEKYMQVCNLNTCEVVHNFEDGIGMGRNYNTEPNGCLDAFTSPNEQLDNNLCAPAKNLGAYFPMGEHDVQRHAVPGGGAKLSGGDTKVAH